MQKKLDIENKMERLWNEYNKNDNVCKSFLKKKPSRRKKRESKFGSDNFEIVIENAETAEVKSFHGNESKTNTYYSMKHAPKNIYSETDRSSKLMSSEGRSNDRNVIIDGYSADTMGKQYTNISDFYDNDLDKKDIKSHYKTINEVENCFDKNGNEIIIKTEPDEQPEQTDSLNVDLLEEKENTNDSSQSNLNDSELWYIAMGYDSDMTGINNTEDTKMAEEINEFDASDIKIKEESVCSIKGDSLFEDGPFVHINGIHVDKYNYLNKISTLFERSGVSEDNEKVTEEKNEVKENSHVCSVPVTKGFGVDKLSTGKAFPNLTSAIRNIEAKSNNKTEKLSPFTSYSHTNKFSESDKILYNQSESVESVREDTVSNSISAMDNKKYCAWRKLQESTVHVEKDVQSAGKVKFTLKKQHAVKLQYNALGNVDTPISKDKTIRSKDMSIASIKGDNKKPLVTSQQLSTLHRCVKRKAKTCETTNESNYYRTDSSSLEAHSGEYSLESKEEKLDSDNSRDKGHHIFEEVDNSVQFELHKAEDNDDNYNYVMLDGIMSLTLTGKEEIDEEKHSDDRTNMNSSGNESCDLHTSAASSLGADTDVFLENDTKNDNSSQANLIHLDRIESYNKSSNELSVNGETESGDHLNIESLSKITLVDDAFINDDHGIKVEQTDADNTEKEIPNDRNFFQVNFNFTTEKETCDFSNQAEESSALISEHDLKIEKNSEMFDSLEDNEDESFNGLRIPLSIPEPLENITFDSNENSALETIETYDNGNFCLSDNSSGVSVDSDDEYDDNNSSTCESYRIIHRYILDRCTGNTIQKILVRIKERKTYTDHELDDDEIEGKRSYKIEDKLKSDKYNKDYVKKLAGEEFTLRYLQENGLQYPILFGEKTGLGLRVPSDNFKVCDVKACVGSRRMLDVMDVNTQKGLEMTMKEWTKYYEDTQRDRLLNVISLEFSHTKLENYVESPNLVREIDWVDSAWPQHLKDCQTESTNAIDKMKYPKVQKYCLMSVAGCYTDFHIDFGGTSVWYHILHGEKIFWLIPPTDKNLAKYENWVLSGKQGDAFLADSIEECQMIKLLAGNTFIIPSGWIHAVYTPKDSLVFGGNFLHSFNMVNQLKVSAIEDKTHVPMKFRYPFYAEINWYVLERYVHSLTGVTYLEKPQLNEDLEVINPKMERDQANFELLEEKLNKRLSVSLTRIDDTSPGRKSTSDDDSTASGPTRSPGQASTLPRTGRKSSSESANSLDLKSVDKPEIMKVPYKSPVKKRTKYVHLTKYELEGLIEVLGWVESLPPSKKGIPKDLIDPDAVLREVKRLIQEHMKDNPELAITGEPVLEWTKATKKLIKLKQKAKTAKLLGTHCAPKVKTAGGKNASGNRHRRVRCKKCEPCTRDDCMECNFCKDMRKYGGPGRAKQSCISRQCLAPLLPKGIVCLICKMPVCLLDKPVKTDGAVDDDAEDYSSSLMECGICWEIVHPLCLRKRDENLNNDGILNEDLPNSWKCSKCCFDGKEGKLMARVFKGGWRPTPASTPPPLSVSPPLQPNSPMGVQEVIVTEGKRVTLSQGIDSKKTMPKLSLSPEHRELYSKPYNGSGSGEPDDQEVPKVKMEVSGDESVQVKMELSDTSSISNEPTAGLTKSYSKRSSSLLDEKPPKKKRHISPSPSRPSKSSRLHGQPKPSPSSGRRSRKNSASDLTGKRSRRETTPRSGTRCTYDFDDDEECVDISTPLPDKGKGKGVKGRKNLHLKTKDFGASLGSNANSKSRTQTLEPKSEDRGHLAKYSSEKLCSEQLRQTLITHIERRNLPVIKPQFVVRPAPISPPDDFCVMNNGQKHPLSRKFWTLIFHYLSSADLARCQAVCQIWNRWCINPDLWKKIDLSKKRIVQTHLMGIVRRQPEYLDLSSVIMTQKQILWLLERIPLLKTLIVSKCSWATISGLCMSACPLLYKLDVSWATGLNDKCFEDLISPPVDRKPAVKNISRLHRLRSIHLSGTEITDTALELMTLHLSQLEELNISYCTRISDRGIQILASSKSPTQDSLKVLNISGCRGLTDVSLDAIKNFSKLKELYATNCIRIPAERCRSLRHPRLKTFRY